MIKRPLPPKAPLPPKKAISKPKIEANQGEVSSVGEIFIAFFSLCKRRILPVLVVLLLSTAVSLLLLAALGIGGIFALGKDLQQVQQFISSGEFQIFFANPQALIEYPLLLGGSAIMLLAAFLLWSWIYTAMLAAAVDEHHGIFEALCTGWKYLFPGLWVSTLFMGITICWTLIISLLFPVCIMLLMPMLKPIIPAGDLHNFSMATSSVVIIAGGFLFGLFLLLVMSAIPLSMIFCFIAMIDEGYTGLDALLVSRLYVRGHWWDTFFKMFSIILILTILTLPLSFLPLFMPLSLFLSQLITHSVSLFTTSLMLLYMVAVYRDLKQAAGRVDPQSACRCLWMPMAISGILLPLLLLIAVGVAVGPKLPGRLEELQKNILSQANGNIPSGIHKDGEVNMPSSGDGMTIWRDPIGDTGNPLLDIREVSAHAEKDELQLVITLAKPFADYFSANDRGTFDPLINFYFDVDQNTATGEIFSDEEVQKGYDLELDVLLALPQDASVHTGQAYPSLYAIAPQKRQSLAPVNDGAAVINANTLTIRLPYARLNAVVGSSLRVCFREAAQKDGSGLSTDQDVPLK